MKRCARWLSEDRSAISGCHIFGLQMAKCFSSPCLRRDLPVANCRAPFLLDIPRGKHRAVGWRWWSKSGHQRSSRNCQIALSLCLFNERFTRLWHFPSSPHFDLMAYCYSRDNRLRGFLCIICWSWGGDCRNLGNEVVIVVHFRAMW